MIDISYRTHPQYYEDHRQCLDYLGTLKAENFKDPAAPVNFHLYSEVVNRRQLLAVTSFFATQDQRWAKLILWSDWDVRDNPLLAPWRDTIDFRVFDPVAEAKGTILEGRNDILWATDTKHYMMSGLLRFLALYKYGGIWYDMDMVLLRNLKPILDQEFAYVWAREFKDFTKFGPCAAFMGIKAGSDHARICLEELAKAPVTPNSTSRDCDMLAKVYARRSFTVFPSAFFNTEWQMTDTEGADGLRAGWYAKTDKSTNLFPEAFAWHWHGSGGDRSSARIEPGCKFDLITKHIDSKVPASISFIFVGRNDGYGDNLGVYPVDGVKEMNLERTAACLRALRYLNIPGQEIILVECFPVAGKPTLRSLFGDYARVVTIPTGIRDELWQQTPYRMPFYEFLGKHFGALCASSNRLFFHNSDDIFRRQGILRTMADIDAGWLARADRIGVNPDCVVDDEKIRKLVDDDSPKGIPGINRFGGSGGDYMGIRNDLYFKVGGWKVAHGEWDLDPEFIGRCDAAGIVKKQEDTFYHMEHYTAEVSQHRDTPNRPPRIPGSEHKRVDNLDDILRRLMEYNDIR